ncbi:MAG: hypothetical protein HY924_10985 [Elusimicrobia bacterium]|nr:hypothetical protein [Elusimicrobiota bacterium]
MTILALAALLAWPVCAAGVNDSSDAAELAKKTSDLKAAVDNIFVPDESVHRLSDRLFDNVPNAAIVVETGFRGWDIEPEPEKEEKSPASIERMMNSADKRFTFYNPSVPEADLRDAYSAAHILNNQGKMGFDPSMPQNQMGAYKYTPGSRQWGTVKVNEWISSIAAALGDVFAFSTLIHESGHADSDQKGELSPDAVILGEIVAFHVEYSWLSLIDPRGERLAYLYAKALDEASRHPSALNDMALKYAGHLYEIWGTHGDFDKLEALVKKRGYTERPASSPNQAAPVRN